jgi:ribosomal protein S18 acetylase RimI-like enzyme
LSLDARIQQSVVAILTNRPAATGVGPFIAGFDPGTASPGVNYATPRPGAAITAADVRDLIEAFRAAERQPRLEYVISAAPGLEALLTAAGFTVEARHTYLVCEPGTLRTPPVPDGFELRAPQTDAERAALVRAQHESFGAEPVASEADVARVQRAQDGGAVVIMAVTGDTTAGGGQGSAPAEGVTEVAGIAVREPFRRRGLAGAITARVTERLFDQGAAIAWLEAGGEEAWRVYERVGYRPAGQRLYMSVTDPSGR